MIKPDLKFPEVLSKLGNLRGGYRALSTHGPGNWLGEVRKIDLSGFNVNTNITFETALTKDISTFSNNTALSVKIWCPDGNFIRCKLVTINKSTGTVIHNFDAGGSGSMRVQTAGGYLDVPYLAAVTFGAVAYMITDYYDANIPVYDGMPAVSVNVGVFFPTSDGNSLNNLEQFVSHTFRYSSILYFPDVTDPNRPLCLDYPTGYGVCGKTITITNIDSFLPYVNGGGDDPYDVDDYDAPVQEDDPSTPGGGGGGYNGTSDPIDFPNLPRGGALASGGCRAYRPTSQEIKSLMNTLWNTSVFDISTFQKLVDNPMDAIIGLHALPVEPISEERALHVFVGNFNTEISMDTITNQYLTIDCGSIDLKEFWGSALDYSPYTKAAVYLPFVGIKDLTIDDIMPKNIRIKYNVDVLTGDCIAFVKCGTAVLYKFAGNMKQDIPLTGQRSDVQLRGLVSTMSIIGSAAVGSAVGGGVGGGMILSATASGIGNVASSKITTQRSGALGGNVGVLDEFRPYLILHRPVQSLADKFKTFKGYPSNITSPLSSISGYTEVEYINLQNIPNATSAEMAEIKNLLSSGVLL